MSTIFCARLLFLTIITNFFVILTTSTSLTLHPDELNALQEIATTLGIKRLNLSHEDPCRLETLMIINEVDFVSNPKTNNTIRCDCSFNNNMTFHITDFILTNFTLSGKVPPELAKLRHLRSILLQQNYLSGTIPMEWASLPNLTLISLSVNFLSGKLPAGLQNFKNLKAFGVEGNQFSGPIPDELGNLTNLKILQAGTNIAVKQLSSKSRQGNREFVNEIGMISGLDHPNLVKLYGCCVEKNQLVLVYEYMENNSLALVLSGKSSLKLDWTARQNICVGIARGLEFLHEGSAIRMVHRDIKTSNVLLDANLNAKISDFGLARLHEEVHTHISTKVAGTMGYMAPEYVLWGQLTEKADVYSFGVVAMEIVSGESNGKQKGKADHVSLINWGLALQQKGDILEIVDPVLEGDFNSKEAIMMINIALVCTNSSPSLRPTMSEAVQMLEG